MIIGTFKKQAEGYAGNLTTLTHRGKLVFAPAEGGVDYRVTLDGADVGAAWKKTARESGKPYVSVKLDSPFLPKAVHGALIADSNASRPPIPI